MAENQETDYPKAWYAGLKADSITGETQLSSAAAEHNVVRVTITALLRAR